MADENLYHLKVDENTIFCSHNREGVLSCQRSSFEYQRYDTPTLKNTYVVNCFDLPLYPTGLFLHIYIEQLKGGNNYFVLGKIEYNLHKQGLYVYDDEGDLQNPYYCSSVQFCIGSAVPKNYKIQGINKTKNLAYSSFLSQKQSYRGVEVDLQAKWYSGGLTEALYLTDNGQARFMPFISDADSITDIVFVDPNLWVFTERTVSSDNQSEENLKQFPLYKVSDNEDGTHSAEYALNSNSVNGTYSFLSLTGEAYRYTSDDGTAALNLVPAYSSILPTKRENDNINKSSLDPTDLNDQEYLVNAIHNSPQAYSVPRYGIQSKSTKLLRPAWNNHYDWLQDKGDNLLTDSTCSSDNPKVICSNPTKGFTTLLDAFHFMCDDVVYRVPQNWQIEVYRGGFKFDNVQMTNYKSIYSSDLYGWCFFEPINTNGIQIVFQTKLDGKWEAYCLGQTLNSLTTDSNPTPGLVDQKDTYEVSPKIHILNRRFDQTYDFNYWGSPKTQIIVDGPRWKWTADEPIFGDLAEEKYVTINYSTGSSGGKASFGDGASLQCWLHSQYDAQFSLWLFEPQLPGYTVAWNSWDIGNDSLGSSMKIENGVLKAPAGLNVVDRGVFPFGTYQEATEYTHYGPLFDEDPYDGEPIPFCNAIWNAVPLIPYKGRTTTLGTLAQQVILIRNFLSVGNGAYAQVFPNPDLPSTIYYIIAYPKTGE